MNDLNVPDFYKMYLSEMERTICLQIPHLPIAENSLASANKNRNSSGRYWLPGCWRAYHCPSIEIKQRSRIFGAAVCLACSNSCGYRVACEGRRLYEAYCTAAPRINSGMVRNGSVIFKDPTALCLYLFRPYA